MAKRKFWITGILLVLLLAVTLILTSCELLDELDAILDIIEEEDIPTPEGSMAVHFIDVGQGDSILISMPTGENMLIDG